MCVKGITTLSFNIPIQKSLLIKKKFSQEQFEVEKNILKINTVKDKTFHMIFFAIMSHVTDVDSWITGPMLSSLMSFFFSEIAKSNTDEKNPLLTQ